MEGIALSQAVGAETVERPLDFPDLTPNRIYLQRVAEQAGYGDELYGLKLALEYGVLSSELASYLGVQELTHVQEGIELQQQDATDFLFQNGEVIDPITKKPMTAIAQDGHAAQVKALKAGGGFEFMVTRTEHDKEIATDNNYRMSTQPVGSTWMRMTPFAEEESIKDAQDAGFWVDARRAFVWVYRKKSESVLEATIVSVDRSSVVAFAGLMHELGTDIPADVMSHDVPGCVVEVDALVEDEHQRDQLIAGLKTRYKELAQVTEALGVDVTSREFIEQKAAAEVASLVRLQLEIINSLEQGSLAPYVREAGQAALNTLAGKYLSPEELRAMMRAINSNRPTEHLAGLRLVMKAHRYGVWEAINAKIKTFQAGETKVEAETTSNRVVGGNWSFQAVLEEQQRRLGQEVDQTERLQLTSNAAHAEKAAEQGKTQGGCPGGSSFLAQTEAEAKESIFGGKENDPKRWMSCPFCKKKEAVKARVCDTNLKCRHCTAEVRGGKVVNKGNGGKAESEEPETQERSSSQQNDAVVIDLEQKRQEKLSAENQSEQIYEQAAKAAA